MEGWAFLLIPQPLPPPAPPRSSGVWARGFPPKAFLNLSLLLLLAALGVCCCGQPFSSCDVRLLTAVASLVTEHWL